MKNMKFINELRLDLFELVNGRFPDEFDRHKDACIIKKALLMTSLIYERNNLNDLHCAIFAVRKGKIIASVSGPMPGLFREFFSKLKLEGSIFYKYTIGCNFEIDKYDMEEILKHKSEIKGLFCSEIYKDAESLIETEKPKMYILKSSLISRKREIEKHLPKRLKHLISREDLMQVPKLPSPGREETYPEIAHQYVLKELASS